MRNKVLHIIFPEKFFNPYIEFINSNFDPQDHVFLSLKSSGKYKDFSNLKVMRFYRAGILFYAELYQYMSKFDTVIIHSLQKGKVILFLSLFPKFQQKCIWYLWGGDLYYRLDSNHQLNKGPWMNRLFRKVVSGLGGIATHFIEDMELARSSLDFKGTYYECFLYPSNLPPQNPNIKRPQNPYLIQIGNSSHRSNQHQDVLKKLAKVKGSFEITCPLSYGDSRNAREVIDLGKSLFNDQFSPLVDFLPLDEYQRWIDRVDIAIFNHWRQQGSGNLVSMAAMGKTIYIQRGISTWRMFKDLGVKVFDVEDIKSNEVLQVLTEQEQKSNSQKIMAYFNRQKLIDQSACVFSHQTN